MSKTATCSYDSVSIHEREPETQNKSELSVTSEVCHKKVCCGRIRELAYQKWEEAGAPISDGVEFWLEAEQELQNCA